MPITSKFDKFNDEFIKLNEACQAIIKETMKTLAESDNTLEYTCKYRQACSIVLKEQKQLFRKKYGQMLTEMNNSIKTNDGLDEATLRSVFKRGSVESSYYYLLLKILNISEDDFNFRAQKIYNPNDDLEYYYKKINPHNKKALIVFMGVLQTYYND